MPISARVFTLIGCAILGLLTSPAFAQKSGGVLKFFHRDSPASASILEEATISTVCQRCCRRSLPNLLQSVLVLGRQLVLDRVKPYVRGALRDLHHLSEPDTRE